MTIDIKLIEDGPDHQDEDPGHQEDGQGRVEEVHGREGHGHIDEDGHLPLEDIAAAAAIETDEEDLRLYKLKGLLCLTMQ